MAHLWNMGRLGDWANASGDLNMAHLWNMGRLGDWANESGDLVSEFGGWVSEKVKEQLMTSIRYGQKDEVACMLQREDLTFSYPQLNEAVWCAVYFRHEDILLELFRHLPKNQNWLFKHMFCFPTQTKIQRIESNQEEDDSGEIFWIFDTLFKGGEKDLALHVATTYPDKILINQEIWPEVIPELDKSPGKCCFNCVIRSNRIMEMPRLLALTGDPDLTRLKKWCMENCHAQMVFYLAVITKDWELVERMASTQTSLDVHPVLPIQTIQFLMNDTSSDSIRGCSAACAILKSCPLNDDIVSFPDSRDQLAKICEDQGFLEWALLFSPDLAFDREQLAEICELKDLLDWALLFSSDLAFVKRHYKNCQNQSVLNYILEKLVYKDEWEFASELLPGCSNVRVLMSVLRRAFKKDQLTMAKTVMSKVDPSTMDTSPFGLRTLLQEAVGIGAKYYPARARHLARLCIASGLSTFLRPSTSALFIGFLFPSSWIPSLRILKLLVESGSYTHRMLFILHERSCVQQSLLLRDFNEEEEKCCRYLQEAAATPCSLRHLARLTISHSIGCRPGRSERIEALPLPNSLKYYLRFRDVLADDKNFKKKFKDKQKLH